MLSHLFKSASFWKYNAHITRRAFSARNCWKCNESTTELFCSNCKSLQRPDSTINYFQMLEVDQSYTVNDSVLSNRLKTLQKILHPDKFSNKSREEQLVSEEYSALVNKAYSTLNHPLSRGIYLLRLNGLEIEEKTQSHNEFLSEIMERNEAVENAETEADILTIEEENKRILESLKSELGLAFQNKDFSNAQSTLIRMKYYYSIEGQIKSIIRKMKIVK